MIYILPYFHWQIICEIINYIINSRQDKKILRIYMEIINNIKLEVEVLLTV